MFKIFVTEIENHFRRKIKRFRSDRCTKYEFNLFNEFCKSFGIIYETTTTYFSEMNGKTEKKRIKPQMS